MKKLYKRIKHPIAVLQVQSYVPEKHIRDKNTRIFENLRMYIKNAHVQSRTDCLTNLCCSISKQNIIKDELRPQITKKSGIR